jgi:hypothetical protein
MFTFLILDTHQIDAVKLHACHINCDENGDETMADLPRQVRTYENQSKTMTGRPSYFVEAGHDERKGLVGRIVRGDRTHGLAIPYHDHL